MGGKGHANKGKREMVARTNKKKGDVGEAEKKGDVRELEKRGDVREVEKGKFARTRNGEIPASSGGASDLGDR